MTPSPSSDMASEDQTKDSSGKPTRILVILNPASGQEDFEKASATIKSILEKRGVDLELRETQGEGDALKWAEEAENFDRILVGGGDGTVMEAMSGSIKNERGIPLGQIPLGTANLLARAFGISTDLEEALETALGEGVSIPMDVGYLPGHDRYFALVAGSGWDAEMIDDADREMKNKLGFFAYVISGIKHMFDLHRSRVTVTIDGKPQKFRAHTVMVINVGEIAGSGLSLGKNVSPHDGKLDLAVASAKGVMGLVRILFRILTKRFDGSPELRYFSASHLKVEASPPLKFEIDGEALGETPFEVEVIPSGAHLIVPPSYAEAKNAELEKLTRKM